MVEQTKPAEQPAEPTITDTILQIVDPARHEGPNEPANNDALGVVANNAPTKPSSHRLNIDETSPIHYPVVSHVAKHCGLSITAAQERVNEAVSQIKNKPLKGGNQPIGEYLQDLEEWGAQRSAAETRAAQDKGDALDKVIFHVAAGAVLNQPPTQDGLSKDALELAQEKVATHAFAILPVMAALESAKAVEANGPTSFATRFTVARDAIDARDANVAIALRELSALRMHAPISGMLNDDGQPSSHNGMEMPKRAVLAGTDKTTGDIDVILPGKWERFPSKEIITALSQQQTMAR